MSGLFDKAKLTIGTERYFLDYFVYKELRNAYPQLEFIDLSEIIYRVRAIKEGVEIECIKKASRFVSRGMEAAVANVHPGVKEIEVLAEAEYVMRKAGSEGSNFRMQVLAGSSRQLLTHSYTSQEKIKDGQTVVIHLGATYAGYSAKITRTVALGKIPDETANIYYALAEAQNAAFDAIRGGIHAEEVFEAAYSALRKNGYKILDVIGYGIGLRQSEFYPIIGKNSRHETLKDMVVGLLFPTIYVKNMVVRACWILSWLRITEPSI